MKHDGIVTEELMVMLIRVYRCKCGHVLGQVTHQTLTAHPSLVVWDELEQSIYAAHDRHVRDMSLITDLGELPQATFKELETPRAAIEA